MVVAGGMTAAQGRSLAAQMISRPPQEWDLQYLGACSVGIG